MEVGSIPAAILLSCQDMETITLQLHYSWVVKIVGQYNSLGEYYDPHTASSLFLIMIFFPNGATNGSTVNLRDVGEFSSEAFPGHLQHLPERVDQLHPIVFFWVMGGRDHYSNYSYVKKDESLKMNLT